MKFVSDKKNKNQVQVYAEVTKKIPKGSQCNMFWSDQRTGELFLDDPNQLKMFKSNVSSIGKDIAAQNDD